MDLVGVGRGVGLLVLDPIESFFAAASSGYSLENSMNICLDTWV